MPDVEVDMFEVKLGAALLLRFQDSTGRAVSVLADAGIKAGAGYPQDHVAQKLKSILPSAEIDVIVGTHYDEDHLAGLIDVVKQFQIGEAILPPVRRPRHRRPPGMGAGPRFASEMPREGEISGLLAAAADDRLRDLSLRYPLPALPEDEEMLGPDEEFDMEPAWIPVDVIPQLSRAEAALAGLQLARIRTSATKGAIVAKWLRQVVAELKKKKVPIRALDIAAGQPEYFHWNVTTKRFDACSASVYGSSVEPKFTLLGPSRALIAHHAKKLPIGVYLALAGNIPVKPITASNQLSYVMLFESAGQQMLVCGDAGCTDFWDKKKRRYYPPLLAAVKEPEIVQVAHHAGANHRFYDVLLQSNFAGAGAPRSWLLLSHALYDTHRPSKEFDRFVANLSARRGNFELLTTSEPDPAKVAKFRQRYCAPTLPPAQVGDVEMSCQGGVWTVMRHAVQV